MEGPAQSSQDLSPMKLCSLLAGSCSSSLRVIFTWMESYQAWHQSLAPSDGPASVHHRYLGRVGYLSFSLHTIPLTQQFSRPLWRWSMVAASLRPLKGGRPSAPWSQPFHKSERGQPESIFLGALPYLEQHQPKLEPTPAGTQFTWLAVAPCSSIHSKKNYTVLRYFKAFLKRNLLS